MRILKDFKSLFFVSAHSKGVTGKPCVSADSKEVSGALAAGREWVDAAFRGKKEGEFNAEGTEGTEFTETDGKMGEREWSEGAVSENELEREENMAEGSMDWRWR